MTPIGSVLSQLAGTSSALASLGSLGKGGGQTNNGTGAGAGDGGASTPPPTREEVNQVLQQGASALSSATAGLDELFVPGSDAQLQPEQAEPFVDLIDSLASAATATVAFDPPPPLPPGLPPPAPQPPGATMPPSPPQLSEEERNEAEDAAREQARQQAAVVRNQLANAVSDTLNSLSVAMLNNAPPGKVVTLARPTFSATFTRQSITPDPTLPPPQLEEEAEPAALFVDPATSDPVAALGNGSAQGFVLPSTLPALQGRSAVETTLIHFPVSIRDGGPPPGRGQQSQVVSGATSLTLRSGGAELSVPTGSGQELLIA